MMVVLLVVHVEMRVHMVCTLFWGVRFVPYMVWPLCFNKAPVLRSFSKAQYEEASQCSSVAPCRVLRTEFYLFFL